MPRRSALYTHRSSGIVPHLNGGVFVVALYWFWRGGLSLHACLHRRNKVRIWIPVIFLANRRKARAWVSCWLDAVSFFWVQNGLFVSKVLREYCLLMKLQKANFAYWSRVTHTAARGNLIEQCLVFRGCSERIFGAVITLKRVVKVLDVSGEVHC